MTRRRWNRSCADGRGHRDGNWQRLELGTAPVRRAAVQLQPVSAVGRSRRLKLASNEVYDRAQYSAPRGAALCFGAVQHGVASVMAAADRGDGRREPTGERWSNVPGLFHAGGLGAEPESLTVAQDTAATTGVTDAKSPENQLRDIRRTQSRLTTLAVRSRPPSRRLRAGRIDCMGHNMSTHLGTIDEANSLDAAPTRSSVRSNGYYFRSNQLFADVRAGRRRSQDEPRPACDAVGARSTRPSRRSVYQGRRAQHTSVRGIELPATEGLQAYSYDELAAKSLGPGRTDTITEAAEALIDVGGLSARRPRRSLQGSVPPSEERIVNDYRPITL